MATPPVDQFIARKTSYCSSIIAVLGSLYCDLPTRLDLSKGPADLAGQERFRAFQDILTYVSHTHTGSNG
jgi:hypothetical protein